MKIISLAAIAAICLVTGCASVDLTSEQESIKAKHFAAPSANNAGLYVYRNSWLGLALKKDIWIDDECLGESAPNVFFHTEVAGGKTVTVSTESEFSPNHLTVTVEPGKNYFFRQYIKMGVFVGGANVEQVSENEGQNDIVSLDMAQAGHCSDME